MVLKTCWSCIFCFTCILSCYHLSNAQEIHLYSEPDSKGKQLDIRISQCSNLPEDMAGNVSSINTEGHCMRFFNVRNCSSSGNFIEMMPWSPTHYNLGYWGFDKKTMSISSCRNACDRDITGDPPELGERLDLEVYSLAKFKGAYKKLKVQGCTPVPSRFIFQFKSVKTLGRCFQLYNNEKCQDIGPFTALSSIELRPGTPFHSDISWWAFNEVQAVSHCTYKCNATVKEWYDKSIQNQSDEVPLKPHDVVLFDRKNYAGNTVHLTVLSCIDLGNEWEGAAVSIKSFNGSCVTLYETRGCAGDSINVAGFNPDLSVRSFDALTRSIQPCYSLQDSKRTGRSDVINGPAVGTLSPLIISIIVILPLFGVILSIVLVLFITRKCNPYKDIMDKLSDKEIDDFLRGLGMDLESNDEGEAGGTDGDYSAELVAQNKPYNEAYEIPRANIKFNTKCTLGMGEFGVVYKGTMLETDEVDTFDVKRRQVAVKTVKPGTSVQYLRALLKEVKIMLYVGRHEHVVQMVGCCTENLRKGEILLLLEFCSGGSLESFLLLNRTKFKNLVKKGRLLDGDENKTSYANNLDSAFDRYQNVVGQRTVQNFDFFQLLRWCTEIANGMEFLTSKKVIHSDLAARNVLLDENFLAKICDFGLSRQLYCYTEYVKKKQEPLPWRWLAIESLTNLQFSTKSDVWGFGVLCWEIFTLGEKPYPGVLYNDDFLRNLKDGMRMTKPKYTVSECYNLMIKCWDEEPDNRPSFTEIHEELQDIFASLRPPQTRSAVDYLGLHES